MSTYVLNPNGTINATIVDNDNNSSKSKIDDIKKINSELKISKKSESIQSNILNATDGYIIAVETLGSFKSGKNFAESPHNLFSGIDTTPDQDIQNGIIGTSTDLYSYAHGDNMILKDGSNSQHIGPSPVKFYKSYNSFFDLDNRISENADGVQIFATDLDFLGIPQVYIEPSKVLSDLNNTVSSLGDFLIAATIPIVTMSLLQALIQSSQNGPPDPFGLLPEVNIDSKEYQYGKYITYTRIDEISNPITAAIFNPIIDGLVSLLNTMEKIMGFPKNPLTKGSIGLQIVKLVLQNLTGFILGYILYLVPGFKIGKYVERKSIATFTSLLFESIISLTTADKAKHNYNLLIRKIVKNNYFRKELKKARDVEYSSIIDFSSFFYKFVGQRIAAGVAAIQVLNQSLLNKSNNLFAVTKMNELPEFEAEEGDSNAVVVGPSIFDSSTDSDTLQKDKYFNRSIYSLTSLVTNEGYANSYLKYHEALTKQTNEIVNEYKVRLDQKHVEQIEKIIDSDYMPFSIQDLRTNEVFKFHAFVESYSDSFSPEWEDAGKGFGRMDPIKIYKGTTRSISVDFHLIAMNPADFDNMWYMINRLIALIYPQWSKSIPASEQNQKTAGIKNDKDNIPIPFGQPFTQIPVNSPIIRLRLGDLFTSNYSKKNLARIFGFDEDKDFKKSLKKDTSRKHSDLQTIARQSTLSLKGYAIADFKNFNDSIKGQFVNKKFIEDLNFKDDSNREFLLLNENFTGLQKIYSDSNLSKLFKSTAQYSYKAEDEIELDDILKNESQTKEKYKLLYLPLLINEDNVKKVLILLFVSELNFDNPMEVLNMFLMDLIKDFIEKDNKLFDPEKMSNLDSFMKSTGEWQYNSNETAASLVDGTADQINNPIVKSFESNLGEGIAGTIQSFGIAYDQSIPWQLDKGSRAPMAAKINMQISVIHDILPGLDHNGIMRAPTYRVGAINREMFGGSVRDELPVDFVYKGGKQ